LTVFLTVKVFQRFQRQEIPSIDLLHSKIRCNKGIAGLAHRWASGIVEFFANGPQPLGRNFS
jgi:hypothetical protein